MFPITPADLTRFLGRPPEPRLYQGLVEICPAEEISTPLRFCHFIGQCAHESSGFTHFHEVFDYSAEDLLRIFRGHITPGDAASLGRSPGGHVPPAMQVVIANIVYANRYGNGPAESGDGSRYRGRGAIQTTFRDNYAKAAAELGVDLLEHPELLEDPYHAIRSAGVYWRDHGINAYADADDLRGVTMKINSAQEGLASRGAWTERAKAVWLGVGARAA